MGFIGDISVSGTVHSVAHTLFGTCTSVTTGSGIRTLNVTCSDLTNLIDGVVLNVYFSFAFSSSTNPPIITNSNSTIYMKLNGGTSIRVAAREGSLGSYVPGAFKIIDGAVVSFVYNSSKSIWQVINNNNEEFVIFSGDETGQFYTIENPDDFSELEIFYTGYNGGSPNSIRLQPPGTNINIALSVIEPVSTASSGKGQLRIRMSYWSYSYKTVGSISAYYWNIGANSGFWAIYPSEDITFTEGPVIHVNKVVGYNRKYYTV